MAGVSNLKLLMMSVNPEIVKGEFVFCTISEKSLPEIKAKPLLIFREKEGTTIIIEKKDADTEMLSYVGTWTLITLTIHSDLNAVGFLAEIARALADAKISVNAVSAYYHDHLFVPSENADDAMRTLKKLSKAKG